MLCAQTSVSTSSILSLVQWIKAISWSQLFFATPELYNHQWRRKLLISVKIENFKFYNDLRQTKFKQSYKNNSNKALFEDLNYSCKIV